jgi:hypothetical protein
MSVTCSDYRLERRLLALKKMLTDEALPIEKRADIEKEVAELEKLLGMD